MRSTLQIHFRGEKTARRFEGLLHIPRTQHLGRGHWHDGQWRGGHWAIGRMHEELWRLSLERFVPLDDRTFANDRKAFNLHLAVRAQATMSGGQICEVSYERLIVDAGLTQVTQSDASRARAYVRRGFEQLCELGLCASAKVNEAGRWLVTLADPRGLKENEPEPKTFEGAPSPDPRFLTVGTEVASFKLLRSKDISSFLCALERTLQKEVLESQGPLLDFVQGLLAQKGGLHAKFEPG